MKSHKWVSTTLGDQLTFQRGYDITKKEQENGRYPVVSSSGPNSTHTEFMVAGPGIVIGRKGTLGSVFFVQSDYWPHDTTLWVKDFHGNFPKYAYYFLKTMRFEQYDCGASNPTLNRNHIHTLPVTYPPISTQRKIASILSAYDDLIENNTRRIAILEEMAQTTYREWFVNFRFPGHEHVKLFDSPLGQIPEGWKVLPIDALCSKITDGAHRSPKSVEKGLPMASMKDMEAWRLDLTTARKITQEDFDVLVRIDCQPLKGDVLIAKDGASYLKYIFVVEEQQEVVLLSSVAILRPNGTLNPYLLAMKLNDPQTKGRLANYVTGAAIPRVILKDFKRFQIIIPPPIVQAEWFAKVEPAIQLIHRLLKKNDNLRITRDLLLPKLISGKLDVEDIDIEVGMTAEALDKATA